MREVFLTTDDGATAPGYLAAQRCLAATAEVRQFAASSQRRWDSVGTALLAGDVAPELLESDDGDRVQVWQGATPALLTHLAVHGDLFGSVVPDLVVAGFNHGPNVGTMALHSGTLGAAATARTAGISAIAISVDDYYSRAHDYVEGEPLSWDAAEFVLSHALVVARHASAVFGVSINIPSRPVAELAGARVSTVDTRAVRLSVQGSSAVPRFPLALLDSIDAPDSAGTDIAALAADLVSVTPIRDADTEMAQAIAAAVSAALG